MSGWPIRFGKPIRSATRPSSRIALRSHASSAIIPLEVVTLRVLLDGGRNEPLHSVREVVVLVEHVGEGSHAAFSILASTEARAFAPGVAGGVWAFSWARASCPERRRGALGSSSRRRFALASSRTSSTDAPA